jgi:hypothetical protein
MSETAVAVMAPTPPAAIETGNVLSILNRVITDPNLPMERVNQAFDFYERMEKRNAKIAFDLAMANAKSEIPTISKNRTVDFTSAKGRTHYQHEDLGEIARTVDPILSKYGLSYRWRTSAEPNEPVRVTCIVSHREGHFEENSLPAPRDESGNKNNIQAIGSTVTYLQRYTLKAALGLAVSHDDDGQGGEKPRKSSSAAKKDGTTEKFNKIKLDFETATSVDHLRALKDQHWPEVEALPGRWFELLEDTYSLMFDELKGAEQARAS